MDALGANPFAILTFIAAPAILINASSVMALGTGNRFARAVDRARNLAAQAADSRADPETRMRVLRQLGFAERRALLLVRTLTAFYVSVGSFAAASLGALLGAICTALGQEVLRHVSRMLSTAEVASEMYISTNTVKTHLKNIFRKLAAGHRGEAVRRARQLELI